MKTCTECDEAKDLEEFPREKRGRYGRGSKCLACGAKRERQARAQGRRKEKIAHLRNPVTQEDINGMEEDMRQSRRQHAMRDRQKQIQRQEMPSLDRRRRW